MVTQRVKADLAALDSPSGLSVKSGRVAPYQPIEPNGWLYVDYKGQGAASLDISRPGPYTSDSTEADTVRQAVRASLKGQGFTPKADAIYDTEGSGMKLYASDRVICLADSNVYGTSDEDGNDIQVLGALRCGEVAKYTPALDSYRKLEPFAAAYRRGEPKGASVGTVLFLEGKPKKSRTAGYQTAALGVGSAIPDSGAALLFWKKDGEDWTYFTGGQAPPPCSDYKTPDLKAAFAGEPCWVEGQAEESTVQ